MHEKTSRGPLAAWNMGSRGLIFPFGSASSLWFIRRKLWGAWRWTVEAHGWSRRRRAVLGGAARQSLIVVGSGSRGITQGVARAGRTMESGVSDAGAADGSGTGRLGRPRLEASVVLRWACSSTWQKSPGCGARYCNTTMQGAAWSVRLMHDVPTCGVNFVELVHPGRSEAHVA